MSLLDRLVRSVRKSRDADDLAPFADRLKFGGLTNNNGVLNMTVIEEQSDDTSVQLIQSMAVSMIKHLGDAENYVETVFRAPRVSPDRFVFRVERASGSTPHDLRLAADAKAESLEWTLRQVRGHISLLESLPTMYAAMKVSDDDTTDERVTATAGSVIAGIKSLLDGEDCGHCVTAEAIEPASA